ncbi:MAG: TonB C-terminal domain-containing protein [Steroidobacteraceae bacterium]
MKFTQRTTAGVMGIAATVLLHSLFFAAALWGGGARKIARLPDAVGSGANSGIPGGSSTEREIIVQLSPNSATPELEPASNQAQLTAQIQKPSLLQITGPDSMPLPPLEFEEEGEPTEASDADIIARTKLTGLYESQIRARIERAWIQPTETIRALVYSCRVKVRQKRDGQVEDVSLENCEGSFEWLNSLVKAIYSASPLPGAPHPGVFAHSFSMQFRSVVQQ